ncbi:hypothetical protein I0D00_15665 [Pseudomonas lalucatii]|uniref:YCII-related domain-containing protein n=1 Tax=Pseudomonas lalucatii TaxID=1424203 RepID=A0ABS5Q3N1_9PSED|nr:hypothetical protein [Pseudomonas lalucatii]MBS7663366.1 hypothetical protein [Pseudomonas lalucatii]MBS7689880.1 hypothetical protein [Pseudomonas lalucatii]MBS7724986.1 hypothetical protein [Pseudomonas lalucatii]QVM87051.1 hypothetical protein I0D68_16365 [Pseudomonas lalucatii]
MAKYLFVYHGGSKPQAPDEVVRVMRAWEDWFGAMGSAAVDPGNPVGLSSTVNSDGSVTSNGGSNPASGYSLIEATSLEAAIGHARKCPILAAGGSIELAEIIEM